MFYSNGIDTFRTLLFCGLVVQAHTTLCRFIDDVINGEVEFSGLTPGSTASFHCFDGYALVGDKNRSCTENGVWSGSTPSCIRSCPSPPEPPFAEFSEMTNGYFPVGTFITYRCRSGFKRDPFMLPVVRCDENFSWSDITNFCTRVSCELPKEIMNGNVELTGNVFDSTATYSCNEGFTLIGSQQSVCTADGVWNGTVPICIEIISTTENIYSSPAVTSITEEPTINSTIPSMEDQCVKIQALQETMKSCTSTPEDWTKYLQLQYLYLQIENIKLDIERKKKEAEGTSN